MRINYTLPILLFFATLFQFDVDAQKQNYVWHFGENAGLDFNTPVPTPIMGSMHTLEGLASISDTEGSLLFYTNGITVWDRSHQAMPNGFGLQGGNSSTQSALIVPLPNSCTKYYVFTTGDYFPYDGMSYSVVDMTLNHGYGDVINSTKNTLVIDSTLEMLTAILHSNGVDVWILTHTIQSNNFYAYLLTETGLTAMPIVSSLGSFVDHHLFGSIPGPLRSSHDGTKIVSAVTYGDICEMFDFNNTTGEITNHFDLKPFIGDHDVYGIEFSPNDSLLYLAGFSEIGSALINQINLYNNNLEVTTVATHTELGEEFGALQMGPDKKIYLARRLRPFIDVIHQPDLPGIACQYEAEAVSLLPGTVSTFGLPNPAPYSFCPNPFYTKDTVICPGDTLPLTISLNETKSCPRSFVWYDGTTDTINLITAPGNYWIEITDVCKVYRDTIHIDSVLHQQISATICEGESFEGYTETGIYADTFSTLNHCDSIRILDLVVNPITYNTIEREICTGDSYQGYTQSGIYIDTILNEEQCPTIRTIRLTVIECAPIITYDLDDCVSYMHNGSHMDYSEFTPEYPTALNCGEVNAQHVSRAFPEKHSCTPGVNGSPAMCVSAIHPCEYEEGLSESVIIEFTVNPTMDSVIRITGLAFYERAPVTYDWINGASGPNNFPYYFGFRILKNGTEIFKREIIHTNPNWKLHSFNFVSNENFDADSTAVFRIEFLPYCTTLETADVSAWDLDEINIYGGCVSPLEEQPFIDGYVMTKTDQRISNTHIYLADNPGFSNQRKTITNEKGYYKFDSLKKGSNYFVKAYKNDDVLNGVSAIDLVKIQKHLLGIESFETLDQYIAADINRSERVSAIDLIELQKLLLGMYNGFPKNTSWRFGVLPQDFTGNDLSKFQEIKIIESLETEHLEINFMGIKVGDLNGDVD